MPTVGNGKDRRSGELPELGEEGVELFDGPDADVGQWSTAFVSTDDRGDWGVESFDGVAEFSAACSVVMCTADTGLTGSSRTTVPPSGTHSNSTSTGVLGKGVGHDGRRGSDDAPEVVLGACAGHHGGAGGGELPQTADVIDVMVGGDHRLDRLAGELVGDPVKHRRRSG